MRNAVLRACFILTSIFLITGISSAQNQSADYVVGQYWSPKKDGKIEVFKRGDKYFGKIIWGNNPRKDTKNPRKELRNQDVVGMVFLSNFVFSNGVYSNGQIYDPETGKTYSCKMWLENGNLKVRGYLGLSLLGRTETFIKVQ